MLRIVWILIFTSISLQTQTFRVAMAPIEGTLDPAFNSNDPDTAFSRALFDYFLEPLPDGTVGPNLAADWTISEDGLVYTFDLVEGVTFHDGTPLSAADVVWTYNRLRDPNTGSPASNLLDTINVIEAPDDQTIVFILSTPEPDFLLNLASRWALVVKAGTTDFSVGNISNVGSGPFTLETYRPGDQAVFQAYEDYWQPDTPKIDTMIHIYEPDDGAQVNMLLNGDADFIFKVPIDAVSQLQNTESIEVVQKLTNQHPVIRLRTDVGPGSDPLVRQAFKLATDRDQINQEVLGGFGVVGNNDPIGPVFDAYYPGNMASSYDPQGACELLSQAGYGSPAFLPMTLHGPDALNYPELAAELQAQWELACIYVDISILPESTYYALDWLEVELGITGWGDRPTPQQVLEEAYASSGQFNETRWRNPTLDTLIQEASQIADEEARADVYAEIATVFAQDGPIIVPYFAPVIGGNHENVMGLEMAPFPGLTDYRTVSVG